MAKHTKGPWTVDSVNSEALHDIILGYQIPGAGYPILVANVYDDENPGRPGDISSVEAEANARLMAAAPDMYAALEAAPVIRIGETLEEFRVRYNRWHREIRVPAVNLAGQS